MGCTAEQEEQPLDNEAEIAEIIKNSLAKTTREVVAVVKTHYPEVSYDRIFKIMGKVIRKRI